MGALKAQKRGAPPVFSSSRRKPTSKMAEAAAVTKYAIGDIVYVPLPPNFESKSDLSKGKITSVDKGREKAFGVVYKVQLPMEDEDVLGDVVEFADEGTEIWATECMLSNVNALPRVPERVKGVRHHDCEVLGCSEECKRPKYDFRVKWDGMRPQCSTWESCLQLVGMKLASKGVVDNFGTSVLVKDVEERFIYLENHDDMSPSLRLKMVKNLKAHCEGIMKYFNNVYAQWDNDSDGNNDGVFPNPFEDPTDLYPMTCQTCKSDEDMSAYCGICNERGHIACMADMPKTIKLHDEQKKGAKEFKLIPRLCVLCDKYHGSFYRVRKKCEELLLRLNQQAQVEAVTPTLSASSAGVGEGGSSASASLPPPGEPVSASASPAARIRVGGSGSKPLKRVQQRGGKGKSKTRGGAQGNSAKKPRLKK